jgi:hypothetical protein
LTISFPEGGFGDAAVVEDGVFNFGVPPRGHGPSRRCR